MFGAVYGDIIGSYYEVHCTKDFDFTFQRESTFTDDSVLTAAVCQSILNNSSVITFFNCQQRALEYASQYRQFYHYFPHAGFGSMFISWADSNTMRRQKSFANGAATRVAPIGYAYDSLKQVMIQAKASCMFTHNHSEAIKGAQAVASTVWLALHGENKLNIKSYLEKNFHYDLSHTIAEIRANYVFDSRTSYSVPPSIIAFLESDNYETAIRNAISLGGDADTMACISGGIAEAYYKKIPDSIRQFCDQRIDITIKKVIREFERKYQHFNSIN